MNNDKIIYVLAYNGIEGREPTTYPFAFLTKEEQENKYNSLKNNKGFYSKQSIIVDIEKEINSIKLSPIQKLFVNVVTKEV